VIQWDKRCFTYSVGGAIRHPPAGDTMLHLPASNSLPPSPGEQRKAQNCALFPLLDVFRTIDCKKVKKEIEPFGDLLVK